MGMLDGTLTTDDLEYETYPCEKTVERWKAWLELNRTDMDGYMKKSLPSDGKIILPPTGGKYPWRDFHPLELCHARHTEKTAAGCSSAVVVRFRKDFTVLAGIPV